MNTFDPPLDKWIAHQVEVLVEHGIETYESCQGGVGHPLPDPMVRFYGDNAEGYRAVTIALQNGLHPSMLRRFWSINNGELVGPHWEMTFVSSQNEK